MGIVDFAGGFRAAATVYVRGIAMFVSKVGCKLPFKACM